MIQNSSVATECIVFRCAYGGMEKYQVNHDKNTLSLLATNWLLAGSLLMGGKGYVH